MHQAGLFAMSRIQKAASDDYWSMGEKTDLAERLRELGRQPLDPAVRARALQKLHTAAPRQRQSSRLAIGAAAIVGVVIGSLGLATAGALPAGVQDTAHDMLSHLGVDVPPGHERFNDPALCPGGPYENHGAYVRAHKDDPNASKSPCGKPVKSLKHKPATSTTALDPANAKKKASGSSSSTPRAGNGNPNANPNANANANDGTTGSGQGKGADHRKDLKSSTTTTPSSVKPKSSNRPTSSEEPPSHAPTSSETGRGQTTTPHPWA
jgi:hypothetical protein